MNSASPAEEPSDGAKAFSELPISLETKRGLKKAFFVSMTDIQARSIPHSLKGRDVLGAARTGSGKTLAFLVPMLEVLYQQKWGPQDGLGALIISPTRELAMQTFDVLRKIGGYHSFSAGLVIGGKDLKNERDRLCRMNILVATPGRLLQHMDQTVGFECGNLQMLDLAVPVLDEADRILDMGFARSLNAILAHLPRRRQTLLFSATQTRSVQDLARLSLDDPTYVGVQEAGSANATPKNLQQHYLICDLNNKLDVLYSFLRTHLKSKIIVFMSSGKQVRFVFETFCKLQPGIPLLHLHGKQKQTKRLDIYQRFLTNSHSVLFATDIAARGLDFPSVDWVVQLDAPEDADTYIHRVGRTARYQSGGRGLLFLLPSEEEGMLQALAAKNVNIAHIKAKQSKVASITHKLQSFAFKDPEIKYLGQHAFVSYMKSVYLQRDKSIFKLDQLPAEKFAMSLGLPGVPKIKFLSKDVATRKKNAQHVTQLVDHEEESENDSSASGSENASNRRAALKPNVRTKYDRMFERKNQSILSEHYAKLVDRTDDEVPDGVDDTEEDFITLKRADHDLDDGDDDAPLLDLDSEPHSKRKAKMATSKKAMLKYKPRGQRLVFDEHGEPHELYEMQDDDVFREGDALGEGRKFAESEREKLREVDVRDKVEAKAKKQERKRKRKEREREENRRDVAPAIATLSVDDGYVSPKLELPQPAEEGSSLEILQHTPKRKKMSHLGKYDSLEKDEELALRILHGK